MREGYVDRDGVKVWYAVWGERGPWIAFAPIFQITHSQMLELTVPYLSHHFRVVTMDCRGDGRADRPLHAAAYSFDAYYGDLVAVLDTVGADKLAVVGISATTMTALRLAAEQPERITHVIIPGGLAQWRPITAPIWTIESSAAVTALNAVFWLGWALVLVSTFLINHFELFGLSQVFQRALGRPAAPLEFRTPFFYRYVRHPIYLGFVLAFWATPAMTAGHLVFAIATTGYIFVGIFFEERDLIAQFGDRYRRYREQAGMLLPKRLRGATTLHGASAGRAGT